MHLMVDGKVEASDILTDEEKVKSWIFDITKTIGMTIIAGPFVTTFKNGGWGVSGVAIIAESSISVHTFPETPYVYVDIFSCRDFDAGKAMCIVVGDFHMIHPTIRVIQRGSEWRDG